MERVSFKEAIIESAKDMITDFTVDGECSNCGNCCTNLLPMSKEEIKRVQKYVTDNNIKEQSNINPLEKYPPIDMVCPFRNNKNKSCNIHDVRPKVCRKFICNKPVEAKKNRDLFSRTLQIINCRATFFK